MKYLFLAIFMAALSSQASNTCINYFESTIKASRLTRVLGVRFLIKEGIVSLTKEFDKLKKELEYKNNEISLMEKEGERLKVEFLNLNFSEIAQQSGVVENRTGISRIFGSKTAEFLLLKETLENQHNSNIDKLHNRITSLKKEALALSINIDKIRYELNEKIQSFWSFINYIPESKVSTLKELASIAVFTQGKFKDYIVSTSSIIATFNEVLDGLYVLNHIGFKSAADINANEKSYRSFLRKSSIYKKSVENLDGVIDKINLFRELAKKMDQKRNFETIDSEINSLIKLLKEIQIFEVKLYDIIQSGVIYPEHVHSWKQHMSEAIYALDSQRLVLDQYVMEFAKDL